MTEWVKCSDKLPELNKMVLVSANSTCSFAKMYVHENGEYLWHFLNSNWDWSRIFPHERYDFIRNDTTHADKNGMLISIYANDITHWAELPEPPHD